MKDFRPGFILIAVVLLAATGQLIAQSSSALKDLDEVLVSQPESIIEDERVRACYEASADAAKIGSASFGGIETCDEALHQGQLRTEDRIATLINRGNLFAMLGAEDYALKDYASALAIDNRNPEVFLNRGNLWFSVESYERSVEDYSIALQLELQDQHLAYVNRGMAKEKLGNLTNARRDYDTAADLAPDWALPRELLSNLK